MANLGPLIEQMEQIGARLVVAGDERQHFHNTYLRTTRAVKEDIDRGRFLDAEWTEEWDLVFAQLDLDALAASESGHELPGPWGVAFTAALDPAMPPLRHVLLGINAHVNYDLPQALLAVITADEFDAKPSSPGGPKTTPGSIRSSCAASRRRIRNSPVSKSQVTARSSIV